MADQSRLYPDVVYFNGSVVTMDDANPTVEAVATLGDKIVATGSDREVRGLAGPKTKLVDLAGRTMLPGLIEPHNHFSMYSLSGILNVPLASPPMGRIADMADLVEALRERAMATPEGGWVQGIGYDDTLLAEKRHPTRYDLDRVSTGHPVWITHVSGHLAVANSLALAMAGITRDTPQPEGGVIRKDAATGEPDGVLEESPAQLMVSRLLPAIDLERRVELMGQAARRYLEAGVASCYDAGVGFGSADDIVGYQLAVAGGKVPFRVTMMILYDMIVGKNGEKTTFLTGFGSDRLKIGPCKIIADGSIQGYTGWLTKPYYVPFKGDSSYRGYPVTPPEKLKQQVLAAHRAGFQIAIHANGDAAIDAALEAYRLAQERYPRPDARHRIEHCQMAREDQLDAIAELGVSPSFFVSHTYYWGDRHKAIFMGPERAVRMSPLRSAVKRGIRFSIHSDCPVTPVSPLFCVGAAVNRVSTGGEVIGPEQRLTPREALKAVTIDAAWQNFEEKIKGSIEVGKLADFTVVAENPLEVAPEKIKDIWVEQVIVGGESTFDAR